MNDHAPRVAGQEADHDARHVDRQHEQGQQVRRPLGGEASHGADGGRDAAQGQGQPQADPERVVQHVEGGQRHADVDGQRPQRRQHVPVAPGPSA
jgi:hypothetical protein